MTITPPPDVERDCNAVAFLVQKYGMENFLGMVAGVAHLYARDAMDEKVKAAYTVLDHDLEEASRSFAGKVP